MRTYGAGEIAERTDQVARFVATAGRPVQAADVADGLNVPPDQVRRYLLRLFRAGDIDRVGRGLYAAKEDS